MKRMVLSLMLLIILAATVFQPSIAQSRNPSQSVYDRVDAYLETQIQAARVPGLEIGVVEGNQIVHLRGYGIADPDGRLVTPQTPFILGSASKSVTALAVMQLVEAGKLELDAPVNRYLPWFDAQDITIRHLLNQNSGITTRAGRSLMADNYQGSDAIQLHAQKMSAEPRQAQAGERYQYSNANYVILGALIETVSGQSYQAYMQEHIFEPLDMANTFSSQQEAVSHGMASGYGIRFNLPLPFQAPYPAGSVPAGYLITSAEDMAHYLAAHMNNGVYQGKQVLSAEGMATLHRGEAVVSGEHSYAMGWEVGEYEGLQAIYHSGEVPNFQSMMIWLPDQQIGLILLANAYSTFNNQQIRHLAWDVAHLLVGQEPVALPVEPMLYVVSGIVAFTVVTTVMLLWWASRILRFENRRKTWWRKLVPAVLLAGVAGFNLGVFPILSETPIPGMLLFAPELAWPVMIAGGAAAIGTVALPVMLILQTRSSAKDRVKSRKMNTGKV